MLQKPTKNILGNLIPIILFTIFLILFFWQNIWSLFEPVWDQPGGSDAVLAGLYVKGMLEHGWGGYFERMGAPFGANFMDYPNLDFFLILIIKFISLFVQDATATLAIFYISSFLLVFLAAFTVFRLQSFSALWSFVAAFIFAMAPFHFFRGFNHLMLSAYFVVPFWVWLSIKVSEPRNIQQMFENQRVRLALIAVGVVIGTSSGAYYAFFGLLLVSSAVIINIIRTKYYPVLAAWIGIVSLSFITAIICILPNISFWVINGTNSAVGNRSPVETDLYGMRISQLIFPNVQHQIGSLKTLSDHYNSSLILTEANTSAIGIIASLGFVLGMVYLLIPYERYKNNLYYLLSRLNLIIVLFATVGGFGVVFAYFITPQFRGLNRLSIYVTFISLLLLFSFIRDRKLFTKKSTISQNVTCYVTAGVLLLFVCVDQVPRGVQLGFNSFSVKNAHAENLSTFVKEIEAATNEGEMIFMLPYIKFPEAAPLHKEGYNDMMRPVFYSTHLRWSYGSTKGRVGDKWLQTVNELGLTEKIAAVRKSGFTGFFVNRSALLDNAALLEEALLKQNPRFSKVSKDKKYSYFGFEKTKNLGMTPSQISLYGPGFYQEEKNETDKWHWANDEGHIELYNFSKTPSVSKVSFELAGIDDRDVSLYFNNQFLHTLNVSHHSKLVFSQVVTLQPGLNFLKIKSLESSVKVFGDPRKLAFRVFNLEMRAL